MKRTKTVIVLTIFLLTSILSACTYVESPSESKINESDEESANIVLPENLPAENSPESNEFPTTSNKSENLSQIKYDTLILSKTDNLNIRSGPSTSSTVFGTINKGDMISFSGKENSWYTTVYKQRKAYVSASENLTCLYNFPIASEAIEKVIEIGKTLIGYPYVWGSERYLYSNGTLNSSFKQGKFDCSALMQYIYYIGAGI